jgi:hypothetical protein
MPTAISGVDNVTECSFRTKTGTCTVTPQQIVLARQGFGGSLARLLYGQSILRLRILYGVLGAASLALGVWAFTSDDYVTGVLLSAMALVCLWSLIASRGDSAATTIERNAVTSVDVHEPHPPLTRGYLVVHFLEKGRECQRAIMLPGSTGGGGKEFKKAVSVMREAGLLS